MSSLANHPLSNLCRLERDVAVVLAVGDVDVAGLELGRQLQAERPQLALAPDPRDECATMLVMV